MSNIFDIINIPLGYALKFFYELTSSYGVTLFLFAIIVKLLLFPFGIKTQKNSVHMAKLRPKEQAIRKKYAGRTDKVTQQKLNEEIMALYKEENYNVMGGCLPLLIQMPIIFALYNIIRNPLTYISGLSADVLTPIMDKAKELLSLANVDQIKALQAIEAHPADFASLLPAGFEPINFKILGGLIDLSSTPSDNLWSPLIIIPLLNLVLSFISMRITRKLTFQPSMGASADGKDPTAATNKLMDFTMPLLTLYMGYTINSAVGLYWIFQTGLAIVQSFVLYKMYPIPKITEAEYAAAEEKYGKKKKKRADDTIEGQYKDADESESSGIAGSLSMGEMKESSGTKKEKDNASTETDKERAELSKLPKGINPAVKGNYQKTGKKYNVKKKK